MLLCINKILSFICDRYEASLIKTTMFYGLGTNAYSMQVQDKDIKNMLINIAVDLTKNFICGGAQLTEEMHDKLQSDGEEIAKRYEKSQAGNDSDDGSESVGYDVDVYGNHNSDDDHDEDSDEEESRVFCKLDHQKFDDCYYLNFCGRLVNSEDDSPLANQKNVAVAVKSNKTWSIKWQVRTCAADTVMAAIYILYLHHLSDDERVVFGGIMPLFKIILDLILADENFSASKAKRMWLEHLYCGANPATSPDVGAMHRLFLMSASTNNKKEIENTLFGKSITKKMQCFNPNCASEKQTASKKSKRDERNREFHTIISGVGRTLGDRIRLGGLYRNRNFICKNCKCDLMQVTNFENVSNTVIMHNQATSAVDLDSSTLTLYHGKNGGVSYKIIYIGYSNYHSSSNATGKHFIALFELSGRFYSYDGLQNDGKPQHQESIKSFPPEWSHRGDKFLPSFVVLRKDVEQKEEESTQEEQAAVASSLSTFTSASTDDDLCSIVDILFSAIADIIGGDVKILQENFKRAMTRQEFAVQLSYLFAPYNDCFNKIIDLISKFNTEGRCSEKEYAQGAAYTCIVLGQLCGINVQVINAGVTYPINANVVKLTLNVTTRKCEIINKTKKDDSKTCADLSESGTELLDVTVSHRYDFIDKTVIHTPAITSTSEKQYGDKASDTHLSSSCVLPDKPKKESSVSVNENSAELFPYKHSAYLQTISKVCSLINGNDHSVKNLALPRTISNVCGLENNNGNSCFMIAAVQFLLSSEMVRFFLKNENMQWKGEYNNDYGEVAFMSEPEKGVRKELASINNMCYKKRGKSRRTTIDTKKLWKACHRAKPELFKQNDQDDADQAFIFFQEVLFHGGLDKQLFRLNDPVVSSTCGECNHV